jgi:hypothetical protein
MALYEVRVLQEFSLDSGFVSVLGCTEWEGRLGYVMEYVPFTVRDLFKSDLFVTNNMEHNEVVQIISKVSSYIFDMIDKLHQKEYRQGDWSAGNILVKVRDSVLGMNKRTLKGTRVTSNDIIGLKMGDVGLGLSGTHIHGTRFTKASDSFPIEPYGPMGVKDGTPPPTSNTYHFGHLAEWHQGLMLVVLMLVNACLPGTDRLHLGAPKTKIMVKKLLRGLGEGWCVQSAKKHRDRADIPDWLGYLLSHDCSQVGCVPKRVAKQHFVCNAMRGWRTNEIIKNIGIRFMGKIKEQIKNTDDERKNGRQINGRGNKMNRAMDFVQAFNIMAKTQTKL